MGYKFDDNLQALAFIIERFDKKGYPALGIAQGKQTSKWYLLKWAYEEITTLRERVKQLEARIVT